MRIVMLVCCALWAGGAHSQAGDVAAPRDSALVERSGARLHQIDVSLEGPAERLGRITADDFRVLVDGTAIDEFTVDRLCTAVDATTESSLAPPITPSYLIYLDQFHLTMYGRLRAMRSAAEMLPALLAGGGQASIVSAGRTVETVVEPTRDLDVLLGALKALENDTSQFEYSAQGEDQRVAQVIAAANRSTFRARAIAKSFAAEERWLANRAFRRISFAISRFEPLPRPKSILYFADTIRARAGDHFAQYTGEIVGSDRIPDGSMSAAHGFDAVLADAAAANVRFYAIEARGMAPMGNPREDGTRARDAQSTLSSLALETGGRHFINGVKPAKMVERIVEQLSCVFVVSFDPESYGFTRDRRLSLRVELADDVARPGSRTDAVTAVAPTSTMFRSESRLLQDQLLSAFASPGSSSDDVQVGLIPIDYRKGRFRALAQLWIDRKQLVSGPTWDFGFTAVSGDRVVDEIAERIETDDRRVPIVIEREIEFRPGGIELIGVGLNVDSGDIVSTNAAATWEKPVKRRPMLSPVQLLVNEPAIVIRGDQRGQLGARLCRGPCELKPSTPAELRVLACKPGKAGGVVKRRLIGPDGSELDRAFTVEFGEGSCAAIVEQLDLETMPAGTWRYAVSFGSAERTREFSVSQ